MKLYVVGVGPGDPELITLKAKKILEVSNTIFCPKGGKESLAQSIVEKVIDTSKKKLVLLSFPMVKTRAYENKKDLEKIWKDLAEKIIEETKDISSFVTLGDPSFYSTFFYLYDFLKDKISVEFIPGVSSINAVACRIPLSLGIADESIAIVPANYLKDLKFLLNNFETLVLLKPNKVFDKIRSFIKMEKCKAFYVKKVTTPEEAIFDELDKVKEEDLDYFSIVVIKR